MRVPRIKREPGGGLMLTALIDVVFLLLIFFLKTVSVQTVEGVLPTRLPTQGRPAPPPDPKRQDLEVIHLEMERVGGGVEVRLNRRAYTLDAIRPALARYRRFGDPPVFVDAAPDVTVDHVVTLYDICKDVGLTRVAFAAPRRS